MICTRNSHYAEICELIRGPTLSLVSLQCHCPAVSVFTALHWLPGQILLRLCDAGTQNKMGNNQGHHILFEKGGVENSSFIQKNNSLWFLVDILTLIAKIGFISKWWDKTRQSTLPYLSGCYPLQPRILRPPRFLRLRRAHFHSF